MGSLWIRIKVRTGRGDIIEGACYRPLDQEKVDESLETDRSGLTFTAGQERGDSSSLLNTGKAMPGVPCPVLGIPAQEIETLERVRQRMIKALEHLT